MGRIAKCRWNGGDTLYYYPDVEEITVGFEYQSCCALSYDNSFSEKEIVEYKIPGGYKDDISELIAMMDDGYGEVRVPLLTKEQIEKEGWKFDNPYSACDEVAYFNGYRLVLWSDYTIRILNDNQTKICYDGPCPTINHLRQIMRLLNVK